jgi:hypothetical protein
LIQTDLFQLRSSFQQFGVNDLAKIFKIVVLLKGVNYDDTANYESQVLSITNFGYKIIEKFQDENDHALRKISFKHWIFENHQINC